MLDIIHLCLLATHLLGMAAIVGTFFVQMRAQANFATGVMLGGAAVQMASGLALVGVLQVSDGGVNHVKIAAKLLIALAVLIAAVLANRAQRREGKVKPLFHTAGGLAIVNVLVAVLWQ
ncbi:MULTISPECIES: hypothetical protein [Actinoalloteichus]|uniref:hypothetical protein n=1 Tax=Actinoalloteichus TaxID=65496 RepID=UPI0012FCFEAE|nr:MULTISPECIES: hypothetical protein [Actinoalloteichus]